MILCVRFYYSPTGTITRFTLKPERMVMRFGDKVMDQNPVKQ
jgi:hypothetical protein